MLPATGITDPGQEWKPTIDRFGSDFLDEVRAAEAADRLLLCEDRLLRGLAQLKFGLRTTWLQPVLMEAVEQRLMTRNEYLEAVVALIDCHLDFISVDSALIVESLHGARGHTLPPHFPKLAGRLGGRNADLLSHLGVALGAVAQFWRDMSLSPTLRAGAVGRILENLCRERSPATAHTILAEFFTAFGGEPRLTSYLHDWMRWHFIAPEQ